MYAYKLVLRSSRTGDLYILGNFVRHCDEMARKPSSLIHLSFGSRNHTNSNDERFDKGDKKTVIAPS